MTEGSGGYRTDIQYSKTYHEQTAPLALDFAALLAGYDPPVGKRYLELGYGQGISLNIHAAACPGDYYGVDFNPAHQIAAQGLADASGARLTCTAESFDALAARVDLPQFDYIVLHGVWSWIREAQRQVIADIVDRALAPGGLLYIGYDARPGADAKGTLRAFLAELGGDIRSLDVADALRATGAQFFGESDYLARVLAGDRSDSSTLPYHDLLAENWRAHFFSEMATLFAPMGVSYVGPAILSQRVRRARAPEKAHAFLETVPDPALRETAWDFLVNTTFRCDIFGRGPARLASGAQAARLRSTAFALTRPAQDTFRGLENVGLEPTVFALARDDAAPKRIDQLEADPAIAELPPGQLLEHIAILIGNNCALPVVVDAARQTAERCNRLNRELIRILDQPRLLPLASPVAGAGVRLPKPVRAAVGLGTLSQVDPAWRSIVETFAIAAG